MSLPVRVLSLPHIKEALLLEMSYCNKKVIVSVIYRYPSQDNGELNLFLSNFEKQHQHIFKKTALLLI